MWSPHTMEYYTAVQMNKNLYQKKKNGCILVLLSINSLKNQVPWGDI